LNRTSCRNWRLRLFDKQDETLVPEAGFLLEHTLAPRLLSGFGLLYI
jgi:hypothetical protein